MESASHIIGSLVSSPKRKSKKDTTEPLLEAGQIACAAWPRAVGKRIANCSRAVKLVRGRLVVEVDDAAWQRNLFTLSRHVLQNLKKALGPGIVDDIEFRVMPPRREPQRAQASVQSVKLDEADDIEDPGLRRLYRVARRRELA